MMNMIDLLLYKSKRFRSVFNLKENYEEIFKAWIFEGNLFSNYINYIICTFLSEKSSYIL